MRYSKPHTFADALILSSIYRFLKDEVHSDQKLKSYANHNFSATYEYIKLIKY